MRSFRVAAALFFFLLSLIPACSPRNESYPSLSNKGILPLSTLDPHVGANLFLAAEMERSSFLFNFLRSRGAPAAIEITEPAFSSPHLLLFYLREKEVYAADVQENDSVRQWIVRGPFAIERQDYRRLMTLEASLGEVPVFRIWNQVHRFQPPKAAREAQPLQPVIPTPSARPAPTRRPLQTRKPSPAAQPAVQQPAAQQPAADPLITSLTDPKLFKPLNLDQQAIAISKGFARRADNGDLLHTVGDEGETLRGIAKWYTGGEAAVQELADINKISVDAPLTTGAKVRIPLNLIKQPKLMPQGSR